MIDYMAREGIEAEIVAIVVIDLGFLLFVGFLLLSHLYYIWRDFTAMEYAKTPSFI
jgi:hypothetical protein